MIEAFAVVLGILLFIAGFYTGLWVQRHSTTTIERDVPQIITTEKVVEHEKPVVIQVPMPAPPREGGPVLIGARQPLSGPDYAEAQRQQELIRTTNPEVG